VSKPITLQIFEIVGSGLCVASEDGQKVYDQIAVALKGGHKVRLSFLNVESLTSAFLNAAVGQLYGKFPEEQIKANLSVVGMEKDDLALLKRVVDTAKQYFKNPGQFEDAKQRVLGGDNEK